MHPKPAHPNEDVRLQMSESDEKRELGGLAQSIDALFSQGRSAPPAEVPDDAPSVEASSPDPSTVAPADTTTDVHPADPFESFDAHEASADADVEPTVGDAPQPPPLPEPHLAEAPPAELDAELPEVESEPEPTSGPPPLPPTAAEPAPTPPPLPDLGLGGATPPPLPGSIADPSADTVDEPEAVEPAAVESPAEQPGSDEPGIPEASTPLEQQRAPEVAGAALAEAVDHFLSGHPGAGAEVQKVAAKLRERLALDPLADAVERLVDAAEGDDEDPALDMAAKITNPAVASRLVQRMANEDDEERRAEYLVLAERLGIVMANAFKGALTDAPDARTRRACHQGLIAMGDISRPVIEAMVEDDNRFLVQSGVAILGETGGDGALELVTSALANTDFRVRREAIAALAKLDGEDSDQLVMASLEDPDPTVRAAAAEAAGRLGIERALRPILALLDVEDLDDDAKVPVQVQALRGLGHLGDPGAVQAIEKLAVGSLFSKPSTEVRVAAYQALHDIGTPHARALIEKAREDKDPVVRTTVRALAAE